MSGRHYCSWLTWLLLAVSSSAQSGGFPVCLVQSPGFAECVAGNPASTFSGYDVSAFRFIADQIGWMEADPSEKRVNSSGKTLYYFACTNETASEVVAAMSVNTSNCSLAAGALRQSALLRMHADRHATVFCLPC